MAESPMDELLQLALPPGEVVFELDKLEPVDSKLEELQMAESAPGEVFLSATKKGTQLMSSATGEVLPPVVSSLGELAL